MSRDSVGYTLLVATVLCVVCSVLVASAAVGLRTRQEFNKQLDQKKNVLVVAGLFDERTDAISDVDSIFSDRIERILIDLETGEPVGSEVVDVATYDQRDAARDPKLNTDVVPPNGLSGIRKREKYAFVYLVKDESGNIDQVVLPVYGKGLWSTLYGFIAIDADGNTVRGITFYEHGETPGLGAEVENPRWKALWQGKKLFDDDNWDDVKLQVIKGTVASDDPNAEYKVDGLSGATITNNGVSDMVQYWLGPHAFGNFLDKMRTSSGETPRG